MVRDIRLKEPHETTGWNGNGDLEQIEGLDELAQSVYIAIRKTVDLQVSSLQPEDVAGKEADITRTLRRHPRTQSPYDVTGRQVQAPDGTYQLAFDVSTASTFQTIEADVFTP